MHALMELRVQIKENQILRRSYQPKMGTQLHAQCRRLPDADQERAGAGRFEVLQADGKMTAVSFKVCK